jgi:uncharacterized protein YndB with AHSA1/START domain
MLARNKPVPAPDGTFVITRTFDAPLDVVWAAWSEAKQLQTWWGPKGCTIRVANLEFRPGGFFHYAMQFPNAPETWGRFLYREIVPKERIVWLNSFSNAGCGITRAPFDQAIPLEILNDVTFTAAGDKTVITLHARPHGAAENEAKVFEGMMPSLEQGYGGTLDQLASALSKR